MATKMSIYLEPVEQQWLDQMAAESGVSRPELIRRGLKRLMSAYPVTSDPALNEKVAIHLNRPEIL